MAAYSIQYAEASLPPSPAFPKGRSAFRPILRMALIAGERRLSCYAVVDSGSDHCVFPRQFLRMLHLDSLAAPMETISGVASTGVPTHYFNVEIDLQGMVRFPVYAGFTSGLDDLGLGLLGQSGFFDRFNVHFKLAERTYQIEPV